MIFQKWAVLLKTESVRNREQRNAFYTYILEPNCKIEIYLLLSIYVIGLLVIATLKTIEILIVVNNININKINLLCDIYNIIRMK